MNNKPKLELTWIGKGDEPKLEPRILLFDKEKSYGDENNENILIHGDNLLALKALEQNYAGKIRCVYIDPPFNTGQAFEHYDDNLEHSIWLNLMNERLKILYTLLSDDGVLFIHLDDIEIHYCKVMLDEIFGRNNFVSQITYERSSVSGIGQGGSLVNTGEYILFYKKNSLNINQLYDYKPIDLKVMKRYNKFLTDEGNKVLINEFDSKSNGTTVKVYEHVDFSIDSFSFKDYEKNKDIINLNYAEKFDLLFRTFLVQIENSFQQGLLSSMDKKNLYSVEYTPSRGKYKDKLTNLYYYNKELIGWLKDSAILEKGSVVKSTKITNIWKHEDIPKADLPNEGGVTFPRGKKPEQLLKRIIEMTTSEGDIVLDSFLGSGSTSAVAHKMGRKWIGIEFGDTCYTHCIPRLQKVVDGSDQGGISKSVNWQGGGGFKFYELAPSLLKKDKYGNLVIDKDHYNADMLAASMAKLNGFTYSPDEQAFWKQGYSFEKGYIFTTTQFVTMGYLDLLAQEIKEDESLLICCQAFSEGTDKRYDNISLKKIPQSVLNKCDFGASNYNLNIIDLPDFDDEEVSDDE